jgi:hypothetical protein
MWRGAPECGLAIGASEGVDDARHAGNGAPAGLVEVQHQLKRGRIFLLPVLLKLLLNIVDFKIADRQNVEFQIADIKI